MIERINAWGIPPAARPLAYVIPLLCAAVMLWRLYARVRLWWQVGRPERRWDQPGRRLSRIAKYAVAQVKVLRQPYPGLMHVAIAWGFFVFFLGTALATIDADLTFLKFLRGPIYLVYKLVLDIFTVAALAGVAIAAYRRFVQQPERLTRNGWFTSALGIIFLTVLTGLLAESLRLGAIERNPALQPGWHAGLGWWTPAGWTIAQLWLGMGLTAPAMVDAHLMLWLVHIVLVGALFITIPIGPLLHVVTAPLNIFFSDLERPAGRLAAAVARNGDSVGVGRLSDFTWKQLMQGDACTECGRCQDACPAYASGQPLSPKKLILGIKEHLAAARPARRGNGNGKLAPEFTGPAIPDAVVWSCTTCRACAQECPVLIDPVDTLVDMRRYLLAQQRADNQLTTALNNLRRYGNSFGKSDKQRARWTTGLDFKIKDLRKQPARTLWFVGDYASYSPTVTDVTQATARVFQRAGLDFGLLYDAERHAGNDVRRTGEEGLFELLAQKNRAALEKCQFEDIVTTDPHTYNTLKNEYVWTNGQTKPLRAKFPVYHYTELLDRLIRGGQLALRRGLGCTVTYHDPCYLGRYNEVYEAPRRVLQALGCRLVEMPRHRDRALCCGAGGGRIWMEEGQVKERPSESRVREAAALGGVEYFVVACPKDLTMYRDAVKTAGLEGRFVVKDLIELVDEATRTDVAVAAPQAITSDAMTSSSSAG
jgi:Fe-S oxidoreductase/nitrate reductase gamma subunit